MVMVSGNSGAKGKLRTIVATIAAGFVFYAIYDLAQRWEGGVHVSLGWVVLALVPTAFAMVLQLLGWRDLVTRFGGVRMPFRPAAALYLDSQLARYTPGKVGLPAVRIAGAARVGVSGRVMGSTLLVELASWTASGILVGSSFLGALGTSLGDSLVGFLSFGGRIIALLSLLGLALLCSLRRSAWPAVLVTLLGLDSSEQSEVPLVPWSLPLWHVGHWLVWTLAGACLALSVGASFVDALRLGALLCLAIVLGFLALLAPAGAGVREAVIALGAAPVLGVSAAVAIGLMARGLSMASDVALWGLFRALDRRGTS